MSEFVNQDDSQFMYDFIKKICVEVGPGLPASPQEGERGKKIKEEMETFCDTVEEEEFILSPKAYLGWFKLGVVLMTVGYIFFHLSLLPINPILFSLFSFLISIFVFLMLFFEFILEIEFIDFLYPKAKSSNIIGKIKPKNQSKDGKTKEKLIILGGHHDSAFQFTYLRYSKYGYYIAEAILILSVIIYLVGSTVWFFSVIFGSPIIFIQNIMWWISITLMPLAIIVGLTFLGPEKNGGNVPGALDNLSAVATSIAVAKIIKQNPDILPENAELRLISFGSEEAGVRGSRAYVKKHLEELQSKDTYFINFETLFNPEIIILTSDRNSLTKHDPEFVSLVTEAAKKAQIPFKVQPFAFGGGGTDAIPFSGHKIKSVCIFGMKIPGDMVRFYHQTLDNYDMINQEAFINALKLAVETIRLLK